MSITTYVIYDLISCGAHDSVYNMYAPSNNAHPLAGQVVYVNQPNFAGNSPIIQAYTYTLTLSTVQATATVLPLLAAANLTSCADTNNDKMYRIRNCADIKDEREVLFSAAQTIGNVLNLTGECTCWEVMELLCTYTETATIANTYSDCPTCSNALAATVCDYGTRTLSYCVKVQDLVPDPVDRGFAECCYSNLVLADVADPTNEYHNDFTSVYYQKQTPNDTVTYQIIGVSTGTNSLSDPAHGILYDFDAAHPNPDLSYFRVDWRLILSTLGEDTYTIRMNISIAGLPAQAVDSNSFILKAWSIARADSTARFDCIMDGKLEASGVDFKGSNFDNSLRVAGYFGNQTPDWTQKNIVFSSKNNIKMFESQVTMSNDPTYIFQANNIPECISRQLNELMMFGNQLFISDYNLNNHSYRYELTPVVFDSVDSYDYPVQGRGVSIQLSFKSRSKNNRKTNC